MLLARALRQTRRPPLSYSPPSTRARSSRLYCMAAITRTRRVPSSRLQSATTTPEPGWSQMDPSAILRSVDEAAKGALQRRALGERRSVLVLPIKRKHSQLGFTRETHYMIASCGTTPGQGVSDTPRTVVASHERCYWFTYLHHFSGAEMAPGRGAFRTYRAGGRLFAVGSDMAHAPLDGEPCH